ncbi:BnaC02g44230D [Brassica napus]|uniref:BnaC02g44230D protein n=1 Tax=Brassica napus TaxID=3708 RepID=A0A078JEE5_BRANA|nr:BnaC02g44230D [Brassica napus]
MQMEKNVASSMHT